VITLEIVVGHFGFEIGSGAGHVGVRYANANVNFLCIRSTGITAIETDDLFAIVLVGGVASRRHSAIGPCAVLREGFAELHHERPGDWVVVAVRRFARNITFYCLAVDNMQVARMHRSIGIAQGQQDVAPLARRKSEFHKIRSGQSPSIQP
jgi:hypothetical protein